ncbi:MAG: hypothetical protein MJ068_05420 [Clostridia bacterium]|nr:hypothetical protein [Clostridia bacterium]
MNGREDRKSNDLFYTCSLIAYISRKTKNKPSDTVRFLGEDNLNKIYDLADVYHSDNIDRVSDDFIDECGIPSGNFNNIAECRYSVPTHWDIGKVYKRLILSVAADTGADIISVLMDVYSSFVSELIEDYNSSFYYENPQTIYCSYIENKVL